ncbi:ribose-5-phosphate isomerase RpiA [Rhodobaculum claviforme]|uniref:Ribose-5-phosphate isomerase A n=1 Tax=Rhodobaculum claviforme TaxID=1549854 RepID=A0A934TMR3_9RHOB|nr:ribose-5-phosphate isomerase RpiA [Rhodobaculum claviforme]MBK5928331.1 ribose 5-phosphate isomerase A [Rhodobaculum claviforme]
MTEDTADLSPADRAKRAAARRSVDFVRDGMKLGLGTGSTAVFMVRALAERVAAQGMDVTCVPTSEATARLAGGLGLRLSTLDAVGRLDLTIDGTDEFDPRLDLIKGGGGAHLREKIVATASDRMIVIADPAKQVATLGAFPLPLEVVEFGWQVTRRLVAELLADHDLLGQTVALRMAGDAPARTDQGNLILDLHLGRIGDARALSLALNQIPGVVENGLFLDICDMVIVGHPDGRVDIHGAHGIVAPGQDTTDGIENLFRDADA